MALKVTFLFVLILSLLSWKEFVSAAEGELPNPGKALVGALEDFVIANSDVQQEIKVDVDSLEEKLVKQDGSLIEVEHEVEALARGKLTNCDGLLLNEKCYFLGKRHSDLDGSRTICDENGANLASVPNQADADQIRDYIRHTDVMAQTETVYVWISNTKAKMVEETKFDWKWAAGYPKNGPRYHHTNIALRVSFSEIFEQDDGAINVPNSLDGYPLCSKQAIIYSDKCNSDPCKNGATCVNGVTNYICECTDGWGGDDCDEIILASWTEWKPQGQCSSPCDEGVQKFIRVCVGAGECTGDDTKSEPCEGLPNCKTWSPLHYKLTKDSMSWEEGKAYCKSIGGRLAVNGMKDFPLRQKISRALGVANAWIGLSDQVEEGNWRWLDGTSSEGNAHWDIDRQEPNGGTRENCAHIRPENHHFTLNDWICTSQTQALCEIKF